LTLQGDYVRAYELSSGNAVEAKMDQFESYQRGVVSGKSRNILLFQDILDPENFRTLNSKDNLTGAPFNPRLIPNSPYLIARTGWSDVGYEGEMLECIDVRTGQMVFMTHATDQISYRYTLSSDRKTLAIKGMSDVRIFDLESGKQLFEIRGNEAQFDKENNIINSPKYKYKDFALHPNETDTVAVIVENEVWLTSVMQKPQSPYEKYNTYSLPGERKSIYNHQKTIDRIIFSPNGSQIACISMDKYWGCVLNVWEIANLN